MHCILNSATIESSENKCLNMLFFYSKPVRDLPHRIEAEVCKCSYDMSLPHPFISSCLVIPNLHHCDFCCALVSALFFGRTKHASALRDLPWLFPLPGKQFSHICLINSSVSLHFSSRVSC